jgi:hypothetical protein
MITAGVMKKAASVSPSWLFADSGVLAATIREDF